MYQNWLKEMDQMGYCCSTHHQHHPQHEPTTIASEDDIMSTMITRNNTITMRRIRIRRNKGGGESWPSNSSTNNSRILAALWLILSVGSSMAVMAYQNDLSLTAGSISDGGSAKHGCVWSRTDGSGGNILTSKSNRNSSSNKDNIQQGAYPGSNPFQQEHNTMKSFPSLSSSSSSSSGISESPYYSSFVLPPSAATSSLAGEDTQLTLNCNVRTLNTTALVFTREEIEQGKVARVKCSDKLYFESVLRNQTIFQLKNLREVQIDSCKIRLVPKGVFSNLKQLRKLEIHSQNLQWSSSVGLEIETGAWQGLGQLTSLDLSANNIWNLFPDKNVFCPLKNLVHLNVSYNRLTDVDEFGHEGSNGGDAASAPCAINIQNLDLSFNYLRRVTKFGFSKLRSLVELTLSSNILEEIEDNAFSGLQLQRLNLASNRLVALPPSIFTSLSNLKELSLANNSISALSPQLFSGLDQLLLLDLSRNALTSQWVTANIFQSLNRLIILRLSHNKLSYIDTQVFQNLSHLQVLLLSSNQIESIQPTAFHSMRNLHSLDLSDNKITVVIDSHFSNQFVLRQLSLDNNKISKIDDNSFKNCTNLQDLILQSNELSSIPNAIRGLTQLVTLDIGENKISSAGNLTGLTQLYGLRLVDNRISELPAGFCNSMPNLRVLNVAQNRINTIVPSAFTGCPELRALRLDTNALEELPITLAPQLPSLLWLNVSENHMKILRMDAIPKSVEWLDISHNQLSSLLKPKLSPANSFSVRVLDASYNELTSLDNSNIPLEKLETLRLNNNKINSIKPDMFSLAARLRRVELIGNNIENLPLSALRFPTVPNGSPLPEFFLGGNPFLCDCSMEWLTRVNQLPLRQYPRIIDLDAITCRLVFPRSSYNASIASLAITPSSPFISATISNQGLQRLPLLTPQDFLCPYKNHCFHLCHCCEFDACDCEMSCPNNCTCYHDTPWSSNIVQCSNLQFTDIPTRLPIDSTEIYLDGNNIPSLNKHTFLGMKHLRSLFLNNSNVEVIMNRTFNGLKSLKVLHLEHNFLQQIIGYEFDNLDDLNELYLQNNLIRSIAKNSFSRLPHLRVLRLDGNMLVDFSVWELTQSNGYLNSVMLSGNPWTCDCEFINPFRKWVASLKNTIIIDFALAKCQPTGLGGEEQQQDGNNSSAIILTGAGGSTITSQTTTSTRENTISSMCASPTQTNGNNGGSAAASLASDGGNASNQAVMNNHISSMGGAARSNLLSGPYQHGHLENHPHSAGNYQQGFPQNENIIAGGGGGRRFNTGHSGDNHHEAGGNSTFFVCLITFIAIIVVASTAFLFAFVIMKRRGGGEQTGMSSKWLWCFSKCGINGGSSALPKCLSAPANSSSTNEGGGGVGLGNATSGDTDYYYYSDQEKLFDAYFIYSQKDEEFVTEKLTCELERGVTAAPSVPVITQQHYYPPSGTRKLRLCLHYRDLCLAPDNPWSAEMILSACDASKKVVLLVSNNFLNCEWTNNHFRSSVLSAIQQHCRKLIVIKLPPVSDQSVSNICSIVEAAAEQQLRNGVNVANNPNNKQSSCTPSTTKLEWGDKNFWPKFRILLPTPNQISSTTGNNNSNFPTISSHERTSQLPYATNLNPNGLGMNFINGISSSPNNGALFPYQIPLITANHHHYHQPSDPSALHLQQQQQHFITLMNWSGHQQQQGMPSLPLSHSSSVHPVPSQLTPQHFGYSNVDGFHNNINSQQTILFSQQQQPVHFSSSNNNTRQSSRQQPHQNNQNHPHHHHSHPHHHHNTSTGPQQHIHSLSQLSNMSSSKSPVEANYSSSAVSSGNEEFDHVYSTLDSPLESPCSDLGPGHVAGQFEGAIISGAQVNRHQIQHSTSSGISSGSDATSGTGGCHPSGGGNNPAGPPMYFV